MGYVPGIVYVRGYDRFRVVRWETRLDARTPLKVYPHAEYLRSIARPLRTQVFSGNQVAASAGTDRVRRPPTVRPRRPRPPRELARERAASGALGQRLPPGAELRRDPLPRLVRRGAARGRVDARPGRPRDRRARRALPAREGPRRARQLRRDGQLAAPATGVLQLYRIVDAALDSRIVLNYAWRNLDVVPRRTLPPHALVLAVSPLLDERATSALLDLRARGFDLAVIEVSPVEYVAPGSMRATASDIGSGASSARRSARGTSGQACQ